MLSTWLHFQSRTLSLSSGQTTSPSPAPIEPPADALPVLRKGDTGPAVVKLQELLPKWIDGDFGDSPTRSSANSNVASSWRSTGW